MVEMLVLPMREESPIGGGPAAGRDFVTEPSTVHERWPATTLASSKGGNRPAGCRADQPQRIVTP